MTIDEKMTMLAQEQESLKRAIENHFYNKSKTLFTALEDAEYDSYMKRLKDVSYELYLLYLIKSEHEQKDKQVSV